MDSNTWSWSGKLNNLFTCKNCGLLIYLESTYNKKRLLWHHKDITAAGDKKCPGFYNYDVLLPKLHTLSANVIEALGYSHGRLGASITDNPFGPGGPLYDGADSTGEAIAWYNGCMRALAELGIVPAEAPKSLIVMSEDGFDYLERERE